ncbi:MAG: DUF1015 domain-containing protein [bacterium]
MPRIKPFDGYLVAPERAEQVVSPAYDAVSPEMRREFAEANAHNYLNCMRLREDFPADAQPSAEQLLALNKANLEERLADGSFNRLTQPCLFLYRLTLGAHRQTGVVCEVSVDEYHHGRLRKHESTRSDKEDLLTAYQQVVGVSSSPICLAYPRDDEIAAAIAEHVRQPPQLDFTSADGVAQQVWCIEDGAAQRRLQDLFARIDITYLTDGHHRAASGWRYAQMMRGDGDRNDDNDDDGDDKRNGDRNRDDEDAPYNQLLVVLFCADELVLLPFHRAVRDLNGLDETQLADALARDFAVQRMPDGATFEPTRHGEFAMLVNDRWYRLALNDGLVDADDPVESLDVSILQNHILAPILGIADMRSDPRLDYVSGVLGNDGLRRKCAEGWAVCFACFATSIEQLMTVADAGALMPPKSTYFDPKARSGIFVRRK